jgi:hypothetical protein
MAIPLPKQLQVTGQGMERLVTAEKCRFPSRITDRRKIARDLSAIRSCEVTRRGALLDRRFKALAIAL